MQLNIGIDDTDSTRGGCTTHIAARLVGKIGKMGFGFLDYPNIIRLNPNIPYKTRGNAAVALRVVIPNGDYDLLQETVLQEIEQSSDLGRAGTDPAIVFLKGHPTNRIVQFSKRALWDVLRTREALEILRSSKASAAAYGTQLGLVGALAAVGQTLNGDHTYELVAYREKANLGTPRRVDGRSVMRMDQRTSPGTFNSYDYDNKRALITPHGPDPVLLGIRGESPGIVKHAFHMLRIHEPIERWVIFRTNHGTDAHLKEKSVRNLTEAQSPTILKGTVNSKPKRARGGHVFFTLRSLKMELTCAAFEPTGKFRELVASLLPGDRVTVYGGVRQTPHTHPLTINLEKIRVHHLVKRILLQNPICKNCGKRLKSAGRGQGFRCEKCDSVFPKAVKDIIEEKRWVEAGVYLPTLKAHRHLTKPLSRYGREKRSWKKEPPRGKWHEP